MDLWIRSGGAARELNRRRDPWYDDWRAPVTRWYIRFREGEALRSRHPAAPLNAVIGHARARSITAYSLFRFLNKHHSSASRALSLGESLPMIGKLLGHGKVQTTARYAHLARDSVKVAAEGVSDSLETDLDSPPNVSAAT